MRIWFNKTFSSIRAVLQQLRLAQGVGTITSLVSHTNPAASAFLVADEVYIEPTGLMGQRYLQWCLEFCQQQQVDVFWVAKEARFLASHQSEFAQIGTRLMLVASAETLTLLGNKSHFYSLLPPDIAQVMAFRTVTNAEEFDTAVAELSRHHTRLCVKPAVSVFGLGFRLLDTERPSITHLLQGIEYEIPLAELRAGMQSKADFPELLVMEHLAGDEWSVDCAGREGELLCAVQRRKLGAGLGQVIDNQADIAAMVERLTAYFKLNGLFNIQFKQGNQGVRLLEINARPSGGFGMACLAGVNLVEILINSWQHTAPVVVPPLRYGLSVGEVSMPVVLAS